MHSGNRKTTEKYFTLGTLFLKNEHYKSIYLYIEEGALWSILMPMGFWCLAGCGIEK
jgi:hypothetical protein